MSSCVVMCKSQVQPEKQGLVSVLSPSPPSLRRTLSADMSSQAWLSQNGLFSPSPIKKVASFSHSISSQPKPDIWSLIASQPQQHDEDKSAAPYVHPMLKRSASTLSQKSLQVCTESLGSETGSDDYDFSFSSHQSPDQDQPQQQEASAVDFDFGYDYDYEDVKVVKYKMGAVGRKLPPPLPCTSLRMKPRREDGRLVLEAVSVSAQNNFKAERQGGRLILTLVNQEEINHQEEDHNCEGDKDKNEGVKEQSAPKMRVIQLHRLALMMNKSAPVNQMFKFQGEKTPLPPVPAAESRNAYDYCWRAKPTAAQAMEKNSNSKHLITKNNASIIPSPDQQQKSILTKNEGYHYSVKGCKDLTRSLFCDWDTYSIPTATATS